jgi:thioredoxin 1
MKTPPRVPDVTNETFTREVLESDLPVVVDLYATWCGPCKMLTPMLEKLAEHYAGRIKFVKVNVEEEPELAGRFEVTGVPTVALFRDGRPLDKIVGLPPPQPFKNMLDELAGDAA